MTKKIIFTLLASLLVFSLVAPGAMAALTDQQQQAIEEIERKIDAYRSELIDIYLDAGLITKEQANIAKEQNQLRAQYRTQYGPMGGHMMGMGFGRGCGLGMGPGMGFGGAHHMY